MLYLDTSFITPLILPEKTSDTIEAFLNTLQNETFAVSHWTRTEFSSLMARQVRMKEITLFQAKKSLALFEELLHDSFEVLTLTTADFNLSIDFLKIYETSLRAGDALHLAIAKNHHALPFFTLDETLIKAGKLINIPIQRGI